VLATVYGGGDPRADVVRMTIGWLRARRNPVRRGRPAVEDDLSEIQNFTNGAKTFTPGPGVDHAYQSWLPTNYHERTSWYLDQVRDAIREYRKK
jgi:hypothetical protein